MNTQDKSRNKQMSRHSLQAKLLQYILTLMLWDPEDNIYSANWNSEVNREIYMYFDVVQKMWKQTLWLI